VVALRIQPSSACSSVSVACGQQWSLGAASSAHKCASGRRTSAAAMCHERLLWRLEARGAGSSAGWVCWSVYCDGLVCHSALGDRGQPLRLRRRRPEQGLAAVSGLVAACLDCVQCWCVAAGRRAPRLSGERYCVAVRWRAGHSPVPSWNTDQGVQHAGESEGVAKPEGAVKAKRVLAAREMRSRPRREPVGRSIVPSRPRVGSAETEPAR